MSHFNESNMTLYKTSPSKFGKRVSYTFSYCMFPVLLILNIRFITNTNIFSGLNLMCQFNLENFTLYNHKAEEYDKLRKIVSLRHTLLIVI